MNLVDRIVATFSPEAGLRRVQARLAMREVLKYDAAQKGRRQSDWVATGTSGSAEAGAAHTDLRNLSRELVRNNPLARKGVRVLVSNRVGTGITMVPNGKNKERNRQINERLVRWADRCDLDGRNDLYGLMALAERTRTVDGEALVRFYPTKMVDDNDVPFRLRVLEPDHLDSSKSTMGADVDGKAIKYGVQFNGARREGYWLFDQHPGDAFAQPYGSRAWESKFVPEKDVIHYARNERAGQIRAVTEMASVMLKLRALDDYDDAEVMRKKVAACLAAFVTTPTGLPAGSVAPTTTDAKGRRIERFSPGMVVYGAPGEKIDVADPKPSSDYASFNKVQARIIAAGWGIPYELLTGDLSEVNYTSHRGGLVQFKGLIEEDQWHLVIPQLCAPIINRFVFELAGVNSFLAVPVPWVYTPPRFGLLDPSKEIPAMIEARNAGLDSIPNMLRQAGYNWHDVLDEIEEFEEEVAKRPKLSFLRGDSQLAGGKPATAALPAKAGGEKVA